MELGAMPHCSRSESGVSGIAFNAVSFGTTSKPSKQLIRSVASYKPAYSSTTANVCSLNERSKSDR